MNTHYARLIFLICNVILFIVGIGILIAGLLVKPADEISVLREQLGDLLLIYVLIILCGTFTILVALFGLFTFWNPSCFTKYGMSYFLLLLFELIIIAIFIITGQIPTWPVTAEILKILGSAAFTQNIEKLKNIKIKQFHTEAMESLEELRKFHSYFECCSALRQNSWKPIFPNNVCCKDGATPPCTADNSYLDNCNSKLLIYIWKHYRSYILIFSFAVLFQCAALCVIIVNYHMDDQKLRREKKETPKK